MNIFSNGFANSHFNSLLADGYKFGKPDAYIAHPRSDALVCIWQVDATVGQLSCAWSPARPGLSAEAVTELRLVS